jgi:hypothetical protein
VIGRRCESRRRTPCALPGHARGATQRQGARGASASRAHARSPSPPRAPAPAARCRRGRR